MQTAELILLAAGLAMDACAGSMTNGLCCRNMHGGWIAADGLCFGAMQGAMPLLGFLLGSCFYSVIAALDHVLALILLCAIGGRMLWEAHGSTADSGGSNMTIPLLMMQGIAGSIDALAVGISFSAFAQFRILPAAAMIASVTAVLSIAGVLIGRRFGAILQTKAQILGGLILIGIGIRIFVSHVFA